MTEKAGKIFPHYFKTERKDPETGKIIEKEYECQGTSYISERTGLPSRTIKWRAKQGYIPYTNRMGAGKNKHIVYFWTTQAADEYIDLVNSGRVHLGRIKPLSTAVLNTPANDENYEVTK